MKRGENRVSTRSHRAQNKNGRKKETIHVSAEGSGTRRGHGEDKKKWKKGEREEKKEDQKGAGG